MRVHFLTIFLRLTSKQMTLLIIMLAPLHLGSRFLMKQQPTFVLCKTHQEKPKKTFIYSYESSQRKKDKANRQQVDKKPKVTLDHLLHDTNHIVKFEEERVVCTVCSNNFSKRDPALKEWLKSPCIRPQLSPVAPLVAPTTLSPDSVIHLGNKTIHFSHKLAKYRGLLYCTKMWVTMN